MKVNKICSHLNIFHALLNSILHYLIKYMNRLFDLTVIQLTQTRKFLELEELYFIPPKCLTVDTI